MPNLGKINFKEMTDEQRFVVGQCLVAFKSEKVFPPGKYEITFKDQEKGNVSYIFELTDIVFHRFREHHPNEDRFEIIDSDQFLGQGGFGSVLPIKGTLVPIEDGSIMLKEKERVVKIQADIKKIHHEVKMMQ
jgi:hypothetical protein